VAVSIHPTAIVDEGASIGDGSRVWHWVHICAGARIGRDCSFGQNVFVGNDVVVGNNVKVQNNVSIYDAVTLEDDVFCGPSMVFTNVFNPRSAVSRRSEYRRTRVAKGASIGANATIICGHDIGEYAFIGAGAVVTSDVPPHALMMGVPARRTGWMCRCGVRLPASRGQVACSQCGASYEISEKACTAGK
jgi:UDP-2-acetamido-3-amino-2,3-dideoxy-glucuronate N-acetyltransferase